MRKYDFILIAALLLIGAATYLFLPGSAQAGLVEVYAAGELVYSCSLSEESSYIWSSGDDYVHVQISEGKASVSASSCPDQSCVRRGAHSRAGASIICLPNRVSVLLKGAGEEQTPDAILY